MVFAASKHNIFVLFVYSTVAIFLENLQWNLAANLDIDMQSTIFIFLIFYPGNIFVLRIYWQYICLWNNLAIYLFCEYHGNIFIWRVYWRYISWENKMSIYFLKRKYWQYIFLENILAIYLFWEYTGIIFV